MAEDEDRLNAIAEWLNDKNYGSDYILTEEDLQEIFKDDPSGLREVADKLGVRLTESDAKPDDEKQKEINKWLTKLKSLKNAAFNKLDEVLQKKVVRKFIANNIDVTNDSVIEEKLAGFINEVVVEKKESEITLKIEKGGKVTIIKVSDNTTTEFVFDTLEGLQNFVKALEGKELTNMEGKLSFAFEGENVKICGHQTGFKVTDCFEGFFNCFEVLTKFENLKVLNLTLKVTGSQLTLNEGACDDDYYKDSNFWSLVRDHAGLFGIIENDKFEIVKDGNDENAVVKICDLKTKLRWSDVVGGEDTFKTDSKWDNIFKLKGEAAEEAGKNVTVKFAEGKCFCSEIEAYTKGSDLNSLEALEKLVEDLKDKKITIGEGKKFSLAFNDKNVKVCGHVTGFVVMESDDFETLLKYVATLKNVSAIQDDFKIKIEVATNDIKLNDGVVDQEFVKKQNFWKAVKAHKELFNGLPVAVGQEETDSSKKGKIGGTVIEVEMFDGTDIAQEWKEIFKKK